MNIIDLLLGISPAIAVEDALESVSPETLRPDFLEYLFHSNLLNFFIVIGILLFLIRKTNIHCAIPEKRQKIASEIKHAEEIKLQAELELDGTEKKVRRLSDEIEKISEETKQIAESLSEKIIKEAHTESNNIAEKTKKSIEAEKNKLYLKLSNDTTRAAMTIAEEHIKKAVEEDGERLHKKFIDEFINDLDNLKA